MTQISSLLKIDRRTAVMVAVIVFALALVSTTVYGALTVGALTVTSDGALTLSSAAASDLTIGAASTTGDIIIGAATHTDPVSIVSGETTGTTTGSAVAVTADAVTTGTAIYLTADGLTTGEGLLLDHTTAVIANGGSLARLSSTSIDTSTSTGVLLDLSSTASVAGTQVLGTYSALTTGIGESIVTAALTTGSALKLTATAATLTGAGRYLSANDGALEVFGVGPNGHLVSNQTTEPVLTASGTGYSAGAVTAGNGTGNATDTRGQFVLTVANGNSGTGILTFHKPYAVAPVCTVTPADAEAQVNVGFVFVTTSATAMTLNYITGPTATADTWNYICIE